MGIDINTDVWKRTIPGTKRIGSEERERQRAKQRQNEEDRVIEYLKKNHPSWLDTSVKSINQVTTDKVIEALESEANGNNSFKFMNNFVYTCLNRGNKLDVWEAAIPSPILTQRREKPFRKIEQFSSLNEFRCLTKIFLEWLNTSDNFNLNVKVGSEIRMRAIVDSILLSAVMFGGIANKKDLSALMKALIREGVESVNNCTWIDLYVVDKSKSVTVNEYRPDARVRRWFPDRLTLSLISLWTNQESRVNIGDIKFAFKRLKIMSKNSLANIKTPSIKTPNQFIATAAIAYEIDNPQTPSFLQAYLIGRNESHSLPSPIWLKLFGVKTANKTNEASKLLENDKEDSMNNRSDIYESKRYHRDSEFFIKKLRANFENHGNKKLDRDNVVEQIKKLLDLHGKRALPIEQLLAYWTIHLLKFGTRYKIKIAISTCKTYLSTIGMEIISTIGEENPLEYDAEQWNDKLEFFRKNTIDRGSMVRQKGARLEEFYDFLAFSYGIPPYEFSGSNYSKTEQPRVRSNYINAKEYKRIKECIGDNLNLKQDYIDSMTQLFVLAYRAGLRKHELRKLRVKDIFYNEVTKSVLVRVRVNQLDDDKTSSSRRTIPLSELLTKEELKQFLKWYHFRDSRKEKKTEPLFTQQGNGANKLTDADIHKVFSKLIKNVCNDSSAVFHSLRHSALSNIFIVTFIQEFDWPFDFSLYPQLGLKKHSLVSHYGIDSGKKLHAISLLAGHSSPVETLSTYIHFLDFLQIVKRNVLDDQVTPQLINKLLGIPSGNYARHIKRNFETNDFLYKPIVNRINSDKIKIYSLDGMDKEEIEEAAFSEEAVVKVSNYVGIDDAGLISLLNDYESGISVSTLSTKFDLTIKEVERTLDVASKLANLKTNKGAKRLISTLRERNAVGLNEGNNLELLSPSPARAKKDRQLARTILDAMQLSLENKEDKKELCEVIRIWLSNTSTNKPGINFPGSKAANNYIRILEKWVPRDNICLTSMFPRTEFPDRDRGFTSGYRVGYSAQGNRYYLVTVCADKVGSKAHGPKVISSNAVTFAMHTMAIIMLSRYAYAIKF